MEFRLINGIGYNFKGIVIAVLLRQLFQRLRYGPHTNESSNGKHGRLHPQPPRTGSISLYYSFGYNQKETKKLYLIFISKMELFLIGQSRSGVGARVWVDIFRPGSESELESLKICRLHSPGFKASATSRISSDGPTSGLRIYPSFVRYRSARAVGPSLRRCIFIIGPFSI